MKFARTLIACAMLVPCVGQATTITLVNPEGTISRTLVVEEAATAQTRSHGLMNRQTLCAECGMWFRYPEAGPEGLTIRMWMHNTLIPLDMLFLRQGTVTGIHPNAIPMDETIITSPDGVDAVLEINGGYARQHNITAGWRLVPEPAPKSHK